MQGSVLDSAESDSMPHSTGPAGYPCGKTGYSEVASEMDITL